MNLNLRVLKNKFKVITGLSDHSLGDHMILVNWYWSKSNREAFYLKYKNERSDQNLQWSQRF